MKIKLVLFSTLLLSALVNAAIEIEASVPTCEDIHDSENFNGCYLEPTNYIDKYAYSSIEPTPPVFIRTLSPTGPGVTDNYLFVVASFDLLGRNGLQVDHMEISEFGFYHESVLGGNDRLREVIQKAQQRGVTVVSIGWPAELEALTAQQKAASLAMLLEWYGERTSASSTNTYSAILGNSLGGVISRYAIALLDQNNENYLNSYVSFDSPHNGANVPVGLQGVLQSITNVLNEAEENNRDAGNIFTRLFLQLALDDSGLYKFYEDFSNEAVAFISRIDTPAVKQILINNISGNQEEFDRLQRELDALGFSDNTYNIAISNSTSRTGVLRKLSMMEGYDDFKLYLKTNTVESMRFYLAAKSVGLYDYNYMSYVQYRYIQYGYPRKVRYATSGYRSEGYYPIDGGTCSLSNISARFRDALSDSDFGDNFSIVDGGYDYGTQFDCFIPQSSSVAAGINLDYMLNGANPIFSPFDEVWESGGSVPHLSLSDEHATKLLNLMIGDIDGDGVHHINEAEWGLDPYRSDSDGDGIGDLEEIAQGTAGEVLSVDTFIPVRLNDQVWYSLTNGHQFCREEGYLGMVGYEIGCGDDEDEFSEYVSGEWRIRNSGSKNRCYDIFSTIDCGDVAYVRFPKIDSNKIWLSESNAFEYCLTNGYTRLVDYTPDCGEDEDTYMEHNGSDWVRRNSGSSDRCYGIIGSVTCGF